MPSCSIFFHCSPMSNQQSSRSARSRRFVLRLTSQSVLEGGAKLDACEFDFEPNSQEFEATSPFPVQSPVNHPGQKAGVFRSKPSEADGERRKAAKGGRDRYVGIQRRRPVYFGRNQARPAASRAERTTVREHARRRDREGIDRKTPAF